MFTPLNIKSHYSLGKALSKPEDIAHRLVHCGYKACALTDLASVSGVVDFASALKNACKFCGFQEKNHSQISKKCSVKGVECQGYEPAKLKSIFGSNIYLSKGIREDGKPLNETLSLLAKNLDGWRSLIKIISVSNNKDHYLLTPRIEIKEVADLSKNLIGMSGSPHSTLANILFKSPDLAYKTSSLDEVRMLIDPDWEKKAVELAGQYKEMFKDFFIEIPLYDISSPTSIAIGSCLRKISSLTNIPCVASSGGYYTCRERATDHRVILCNELDCTFDKAKEKIAKTHENIDSSVFFRSNCHYIQDEAELLKIGNTQEELDNAFNVSEMCENYSIENRPFLPKIDNNSNDKMFAIAVEGLKNRGLDGKPEYIKRFQKEMRVLNEAGLSDYFLIVSDYVGWAKQNNIPVGTARGSAAGSLVAYLLRITEVDPIPAGLIFERFYNDGRNTKDKVSLPDIDIDFSKNGRKKVIKYVENKYGEDKVCGISTFNRMKGRGALTAVFSAYGKLSFEEMKAITPFVPDPSKVAGELQESLDEFGEASIIEYTIEHEKRLWDYCRYDDNGELVGELSSEFAQAIRLEDTKTHMGAHAAGVIISSIVLSDICPMVSDSKGSKQLCGFEMNTAEKVGLVKFDFLGIACLDKLKAVNDLLRYGKMEPVVL